ncbi:MAG: metalloregulator ArsR/SmtB family transcription factor [Microbacteriaceae bacterium]|nr:metalloregulator ArsR/SmtB family transcription factor [Microbacteriaceae bacterium]
MNEIAHNHAAGDCTYGNCDPRLLADTAGIFKLLGHETRLSVLLLLAERPHSVSEIVTHLGITQPMASQHLKNLRAGELVKGTKDGQTVRYELADAHVAHIIKDAISHSREKAGQPSEPAN